VKLPVFTLCCVPSQIVGMIPPSMTNSVPVIAEALSDATKARSSASSSGWAGPRSPLREPDQLGVSQNGGRAVPRNKSFISNAPAVGREHTIAVTMIGND
jgi:hypothetical protein